MTAQETRIDQVSTPAPPFPERVGTERGTWDRQRFFSTNTGYPVILGISVYTTRKSDGLFEFILGHLDEEERGWFMEDLTKAVIQAWQEHSFEPLGRLLAGWEETVEIRLSPDLSRALDEAFNEADAARESRGC